jgi:hypothetical protein
MKRFKPLLVATILLAVPIVTAAATLDAVPMQGGMVMPMFSYSATDGRMHVVIDSVIPTLTPLLASNPSDSFESTDPWYDLLDPARQGQSFSRRYGFVMDSMTDPLPEGFEMWIRKLSGTAGLAAYRYSNGEPKIFEPIFGTAGSTNAIRWNGMMFHPVFSAPPGTNEHSATFEAYLVNSATASEVPNSGTGPILFNWSNVPDGRPTLEIGQRIVIFQPLDVAGYQLEGAESLSQGPWTSVTNAPVDIEGRSAVVLPAEETRKYFRMKQIR